MRSCVSTLNSGQHFLNRIFFCQFHDSVVCFWHFAVELSNLPRARSHMKSIHFDYLELGEDFLSLLRSISTTIIQSFGMFLSSKSRNTVHSSHPRSFSQKSSRNVLSSGEEFLMKRGKLRIRVCIVGDLRLPGDCWELGKLIW